MVTRAAFIWFGLLTIAILNGGLREGVLVSWFGREPAQAISTVLLSASILAIGWVTVPWMAPRTVGEAWTVGFGWVTLTLAFELLGGHFLFRKSWTDLSADYNLLAGRMWILVLVVTLLTPVVAFIKRM